MIINLFESIHSRGIKKLSGIVATLVSFCTDEFGTALLTRNVFSAPFSVLNATLFFEKRYV